jgi:septal ring factor EnvC (AmiA/AmiB activator)
MNAPSHTDLYQGLGRLEGATTAMEARLDRIEDVLERIDKRLAKIEAKEDQRKGAVATLVAIGGVIGGLIVKFSAFLFGGH